MIEENIELTKDKINSEGKVYYILSDNFPYTDMSISISSSFLSSKNFGTKKAI